MLAVIAKDESQGTQLMRLIQATYPEYHPIMALAHLAHLKDATPELQFNCHKTIAKYILPELKSVEVRMNDKQSRRVTVSLFDDTPAVDAEFIDVVAESANTIEQM